MTSSTGFFDVTDTSKQPFIPSGSHNSITPALPDGFTSSDPNAGIYAFLSSSVAEVTESVNILFASNSQEIINDPFTGTLDSSITDTEFVFGSNPTSIGAAQVVNFGGVYEDSNVDGIHIIAERANSGDYFLGSLARISNQTSGVGDEDYNKATFQLSTQTIPFGITQGAEFRTSPNHDIRFLTTPPNSIAQPIKVEVTGSVSNLERIPGDRGDLPAKLYVDLRLNGSSGDPILYDPNFTGGEFKADWYSHPGGPAFTDINPDDVLTVYIKVTDWDSSGNTYNFKVSNFKISQPDPGNVFDNHLVVTSSFETKRSASYTINLDNIDPTAATDVDSRFLGLHQDGNDNDLGVRINVYKNTGTYSLLTSSFYGSGSSYSGNDFSFTHLTSPDEDETLVLYALATNENTTGSVEIGISQSFSLRGPYTVLEKSGSNELHLDTTLGANFGDSQYEPIITFGTNSGSISGINPVSINSINSDVATVADEYLILSSIPATASYFIKQKISASAEIDITTSSLFTVENFSLGTAASDPVSLYGTYASSSLPDGLNPRVRFYSGSDLLDTVVGGSGTSSIEDLHLGYLSSGSTLGIHIDVVDSSNTPITSSTGEGISLDELQISGISSSITLSLSASDTVFDPEITHVQFTSPMGSIGDSNLPFDTGNITASVNYVDDTTVTLDSSEDLLLITESIGTVKMVASSSEGFPINISWTFEGGGEGSIYEFYPGTVLYSLADIIRTDGESDANEGLTLFITDPNGDLLVTSSFVDSASLAASTMVIPDFTSSAAGTFLVELKTTDSASNEIPVTWDVGLSNLILDYSNYSKGDTKNNPVLTELSASNLSSTFPSNIVTNEGGTYNEDTFKIISSHTNTGSFSDSPFTTGSNEVSGSVAIAGNNVISQITLESPLFITASSAVTGGNAEIQYFLTQESQSANSLPEPILEGNFTIGSNTYNIETIDGTNFIIDEPLLLTEDTEVTLNYHTTASNEFTLQFKNSHLIFEHEYQCSVDEEEYNYTQNISVRKNKSNQSADLADCITGSIDNSQITLFKPYVTTVGLYDDNHNLLAVGKFPQPIKMSEETDMTFVIRWDS